MVDQSPLTGISFSLTANCMLICGSVYVAFGLWSVRSLVAGGRIEPRWLLLPVVLGILGVVWTAVSTFPIALAIGLCYSGSDTIIGEQDLWLFVLPMSITVLFFAFGTVKLAYSM
ncbi:hypothetical protein DIPPA_32768 [Diplonema papillatum]|nr:hypothetical protein DIPPA_32768 [Diplonema papillatum]